MGFLDKYNNCFMLLGLITAVCLAGCGNNQPNATAVPTSTGVPGDPLPQITAVELDRPDVPRYESIELTAVLEADYINPYDAREVRLDGIFTAPDGSQMTVPGFWDGSESWRVRFTPWQEGEWQYQLVITDKNGTNSSAEEHFTVTASEWHGWLQAGNQFNPEYSGHYLVYHDGTPFYGVGHGDALNILVDGFDVETGVGLFNQMQAVGENFVVWWPLYSISPIANSYHDYSAANAATIDLIVKDAQQKGIFLIFTIWDHPQLRDGTHAWGSGNWERNGFSELGDLNSFFVSEEAWAWQENFYRYLIARWGYSPAIGMWQTVSEINGTNAYEQLNPWHEKVNAYFVENDPYRHLTTASMSGDTDWPEGHAAMDAPQVHIYALENDAIQAAQITAQWTELMWGRAEKPNWVGEFGVGGNLYYPELFHNAIWAALAAGAAMTPAEWNGGSQWGRMTDEMNADIGRLARFVTEVPLAAWNPVALQVGSSDLEVRGWGVAGEAGGLFWVQDFSMAGRPIEEVRQADFIREGVQVTLEGMTGGEYTIRPYDTWQGVYLEAFEVTCVGGQACQVPLPAFQRDMAFQVERK